MKVHIILSGWDKERSIWGCMRIGADRVYILLPEKGHEKVIAEWGNEKTRALAEEIKKKYSKFFEIKFIYVRFEDYVYSFKKIIKIINEEKGNEVFVNISSGSHVVAAAAIFAASLTKSKAYYVIAEKYDEIFKEPDRVISYGGKEVIDVPLLPISYLSDVEIEMLKIIEKESRIAVSELAKKARNLFSTPTRSKFNYYVRKLEDLGFVKNEVISGRLYTKITDPGKMIINAFL